MEARVVCGSGRPRAASAVLREPIQNVGYDEGEDCDRTVESVQYRRFTGISRRKPWKLNELVDLRDRWLNPPEWVVWGRRAGFPATRSVPVARDEDAAKALKKRTLTNLYNARPQWLVDAHRALDAAVAAAYTWPPEHLPTRTFSASCWRSTVAGEVRASRSSHSGGSATG